MMRLAPILLLLLAACGDDDVVPIDAAAAVDAPPLDATLTGQTGDPCTSELDCTEPNTTCLLETPGSGWPTFPGGYCTLPGCTFGAECGMGGICAPLPTYGPHCFVACTTDDDCRMAEGYTCQASTFVEASLCLPPPS